MLVLPLLPVWWAILWTAVVGNLGGWDIAADIAANAAYAWGAIAGWAWWVQFVEALVMSIPGGVVLVGITLGNIVLSILAGIVVGGTLLVYILLRMAAV